METSQKYIQRHVYQAPPLTNQQTSPYPHHSSSNGFPILAIAMLGITATAFLLVSYYIFVTKCCFRWQQIDPLRRFSLRRRRNEDPLTAYSPSWQSRGLDELLIRDLPSFQFSKLEGENSILSKCVVCLTEFQDSDMLRILPKCSHAFHLDCIDIWLQSNANCPLCRSAISGRNRYRLDKIIAPNSSPQDSRPFFRSTTGSEEDFVVIEITELNGQEQRSDSIQSGIHSSRKTGKRKPRRYRHASIMGDEGIEVRQDDDQFSSIQPIRRSFSMDSAADRHVYLQVQEILRQDRHQGEVTSNGEGSSRSKRSIFSFGHGRGSRSSVLPVEF